MQARGHLRLIVSTPPQPPVEELEAERVSLVRPIGRARLRMAWLKAHPSVTAMWATSVTLLALAAMLSLGWL